MKKDGITINKVGAKATNAGGKVASTRRGGRREGAGRPGSNSKLVSFRAPEAMAAVINAQGNKTEFLKSCVSAFLSAQTGQRAAGSATAGASTGATARTAHPLGGALNPLSPSTPASASQRTARLRQLGDIYPATALGDVDLPFFDISVAAGFPIPLDNDEKAQSIHLLKMLCPHQESSYLIRVKGNSMIDADIHDGDIVIVDKSNRNPSESEVALCEFNGEYTLKRFVKKGDVGWLVPANPEFKEIKVTPDDDFSVWGTVTYVIHKPIF